ncbi:winged helix DNA-binding domain-containing protein [Dyadobacter aurulentus]|uniref:winged helix DNA-binding domain-containing protein n=1 Tax=Dyadobacter sp. UC 10 TaxID=2605428 RepID=UPI0011F384FC|nr:winged helix DNA-binding domain-containing protein [Dyadobacter sp. UC 10]KAA0989968.1 winged helix DNA-binding domain-containing protein [Dyadobacter sp. UC 10]
MTHNEIRYLRLHNLLISDQRFETVADAVRWLGAVQAQDYAGTKWSLALRTKENREADVEKAISDKVIVRTWPMRGTLHFVAAEDAHWILKLLAPRIIAGSAGRHRQLELNEKIFSQSHELLISALKGGKQLSRGEIYALLENAGISTAGQRGIHIVGHLARKQILCHGIHNDKQPTYALLDEWVPNPRILDESESLAEIAFRYFASHGPATLNDFVWWTGLKISDAKKGLNAVSHKLESIEVQSITYWHSPANVDLTSENKTFLLPGFDEYMLGYTDRSLILDKLHAGKIVPGNNGMFMPTIIVDGKVEGTWKKVIKKDTLQLDMYPFGKITQVKKRQVENQARKFSEYLDKNLSQINWL